MITHGQVVEKISRHLAGLYPETEIDCFTHILFKRYLNMSRSHIYIMYHDEISTGVEAKFDAAIAELKEYKPIQYIVGETEFYGLPIEVTPDVLIPRPETEELTDWIVSEYSHDAGFTMVDVGTGSGCIAVALATRFSNANVWAVDVSQAALNVAQRNALKNGVKIHFLLHDALKDDLMGFERNSLDLVVSNPPYVTPSEKSRLQPNVLNYEPHDALFSRDDDPLIFYKRITSFGLQCLKDNGRIFFEMNENHHQEISDILKQFGYKDVIPRKDFFGKWRMISARKSS